MARRRRTRIPAPVDLPWTEGEIWDYVEPHLNSADLSMAYAGNSQFYDGSYTAAAYRSLFAATKDIRYWNRFKQWLEIARREATLEIPIDYPSSVCQLQGPQSEYGASHAMYYQYPRCPSVKSQRQWMMTVFHMLWYGLDYPELLPNGDDGWIINQFNWIQANLFERHMAIYGQFGIYCIGLAWSARDQNRTTSVRVGYWGSQVAVLMASGYIMNRIREKLGYDRYGWQKWYDDRGTINADFDSWYPWWEAATEVQDDGAILWDHTNPNINNHGGGWGMNGEHPMPATSHASRYPYLVWMKADVERQHTSDLMKGLSKTFANRICLPLAYETPDGIHRGTIAGVQQFSNYIDGDNGPFRLPMRGMKNQAESNAGMEGFVYNGWYLGAVHEDRGMDCLIRLHRQLLRPDPAPQDPKHTGTWSRHSSKYGRIGTIAAILDVNERRRAARESLTCR